MAVSKSDFNLHGLSIEEDNNLKYLLHNILQCPPDLVNYIENNKIPDLESWDDQGAEKMALKQKTVDLTNNIENGREEAQGDAKISAVGIRKITDTFMKQATGAKISLNPWTSASENDQNILMFMSYLCIFSLKYQEKFSIIYQTDVITAGGIIAISHWTNVATVLGKYIKGSVTETMIQNEYINPQSSTPPPVAEKWLLYPSPID